MRRHAATIIALSAAGILCTCSIAVFVPLSALLSEIGIKELPQPDKMGSPDAVVLLEKEEGYLKLDVDGTPRFEKSVHVVLQVFREFDHYAIVHISCGPGDRVASLSARTLLRNGTSIPVERNQFYFVKGMENNEILYGDINTVRFVFPQVDTGAILEYRYTHTSTSPLIFSSFVFQRTIPVLRSDVWICTPGVIITPKAAGGFGWGWRYKSYNSLEPMDLAGFRNANDDYIFTFRATAIPPLHYEPFMPAVEEVARRVDMSLVNWVSWRDVGEWYYEHYCTTRLEPSDSVRIVATRLTKGLTSRTEKIGALCGYARALTYVSLAIGDGGLRPAKPETVMHRGYGDCKDKSVLLVGLLRSQGIDADPALVQTSDHGSIDTTFPTFRFNHMVVRIPQSSGDALWCDPTALYIPLHRLPSVVQGLPALILNNSDDFPLVRTPLDSAADNRTDITVRCTVDSSDSRLLYEIDLRETGVGIAQWGPLRKSPAGKGLAKHLSSLLVNALANAIVDTAGFQDSPNDIVQVRVRAHVDLDKRKEGQFALIPIVPLDISDLAPLVTLDSREYPLCLPSPHALNCELSVEFDDRKYRIRNIPEEAAIDSSGLSAKLWVKNEVDRFTVQHATILSSGRIPPSRYGAFRAAVQKVISIHRQTILLERI